jgi:beta-lactamase class D
MQPDLTASTCAQLCKLANNKRFWIFDPSTKTWYTPEEFNEKFKAQSGFEDFFAQCQVRDPKDGVEAAMKQAHQTQDRLTAFVNKVVEYYKQH